MPENREYNPRDRHASTKHTVLSLESSLVHANKRLCCALETDGECDYFQGNLIEILFSRRLEQSLHNVVYFPHLLNNRLDLL